MRVLLCKRICSGGPHEFMWQELRSWVSSSFNLFGFTPALEIIDLGHCSFELFRSFSESLFLEVLSSELFLLENGSQHAIEFVFSDSRPLGLVEFRDVDMLHEGSSF